MVFSVPAIASNVDIDIAPNAKHDQFRDIIETNIDESNNDEDVFDKEKQNICMATDSVCLDKLNRNLFEQGYVNSGYVVEAQSPKVIKTIFGKIECPASPNGKKSRLVSRYISSRLLMGLGRSCGTPADANGDVFNLYLLERNFRHLADDRNPWLEEFSTRIEPVSQGLVKLVAPQADGASKGEAEFWYVKRRSPFDLALTSANDRPSSTGSLRNAARLRWRGLTGLIVDTEAGVSRGALDGSFSLLAETSPSWAIIARGQFNDAEVIAPALRRLNITSKSIGGEAGFRWSAKQCPLLPRYGSVGDGKNPILTESRSHGLFGCALPVRRFGDSLIGSRPARDLSLSAVLSYRQSRSFLLGMPFSFSSGAVDGRTNVTALRVTADYLARGRIGRASQRGWTLAGQFGVVQGIDGSRTDLAGTDNPKSDFTLIKAQINYARQLPFAGLDVTARLQGQYTGRVLYVSERLSVGGVDSVRGYAESSLLADRGLIGSIELGRTVSLTGNRRSDKPFKDFDVGKFRLSTFIDGARVDNLTPLNRADNTLVSAGGGVEWLPSKAVSFQVQAARRLGRRLSTASDDISKYRIHFQMSIRPFSLIN